MTEKQHVWPLLKKNLSMVHWQRIENTAGSGVPDVNGAYAGRECWIENKILKGKRIIFQPAQAGWIHQRTKAGGRVWVLVRDEDTMYLHPGCNVHPWVLDGKQYANGDIAVVPGEPLLTLPKPFAYGLMLNCLFDIQV